MNLDYSDFDYKKFENWITRYLEDYGCEVNTVEIICDDYGYDVEINIENAENLPSRISDKDYGAFIFDCMYTTNCLYLKMPVVRAIKIAEEFSPKVLKVNDDSILIGDKNSDTEIWLDVWTDNDGDEDYTEWDYNQQSFNLNKYEDLVQKYLQQNDDFFYVLDGVVSDNFPLTESKKSAKKSIKESVDKTFFDFMCDKDFFKAISKQVTKKEKCQFDFYKTPNSYAWLITYKEGESLHIYMDERTNDILIHVNKNGKSGKDFKFPQLTFDDSVDELLEIIFHYIQGNFDSSWYESKKSATKSLKDSSDIAEKISSEIDKSYWIDKLLDDLDKHYESMEKAWLKNLDKLSDKDILDIVDDCMGKSKTLVGKSEMLKNKMIDDLSEAYDDYIDDVDRQIRIGKSEDEVKEMIETTLENDIKMYLKLAYNNKASSNYFMVKFAEDNLI